MKTALMVLAAAALAGCTSFRPTRSDSFVDKDGLVLGAVYGEASKPYTYKMVSPINGAEVEGEDTKMVRLTLPPPSDEVLTCYICQNESPKGTMYATKDMKWKYLTIGLASRLYLWYPEEGEYLLVFEGDLVPNASPGEQKNR